MILNLDIQLQIVTYIIKVNVKKYPSNELDTFTPRDYFSVPQDYTRLYVKVKKYPSHEVDTFTPINHLCVPQDYSRLHVCRCEEKS